MIAIIRAGARGYVTKTISGDELADAVRRIADGDAVFSPRLAGFVLDAFASGVAPVEVDPELEQLTAREREVLRHIARGYLYKEIAARLGISTKTVEAHVSAVLRKLQLSTRHELSRWAVQSRAWSTDALRDEIVAHAGCGFEPCETASRMVPGRGEPGGARSCSSARRRARPRTSSGGRSSAAPGKLLDELLAEAGLVRERRLDHERRQGAAAEEPRPEGAGDRALDAVCSSARSS